MKAKSKALLTCSVAMVLLSACGAAPVADDPAEDTRASQEELINYCQIYVGRDLKFTSVVYQQGVGTVFTITNAGFCSTNPFSVWFQAGCPTANPDGSWSPPPIGEFGESAMAPGETRTFTMPWSPGYPYAVELDITQSVVETNENNNVYDHTIPYALQFCGFAIP